VLNIGLHENAYRIELLANVVRPIRLSAEKFIPPGSLLSSGTHVVHTMVPIVILFSVLIAWPVRRIRQRVILLVLGLPTLLLVLGLTTPQLLAARVEMKIIEYKLQEGIISPEPFLIQWMIFLETGGRWLLPLVGAVACVSLLGFIERWIEEFSDTGSGRLEKSPNLIKREKKRSKRKPQGTPAS
jgi:hypothetical protein